MEVAHYLQTSAPACPRLGRMRGRPTKDLGDQPPNRIRALRLARGWTQEELAAQADLSHQYIGALERGSRRLSNVNARSIARALEVSVVDLFGDEQHGLSVPIEVAVAAAFSADAPGSWDLPEPLERVPALRRLENPQDCFGAHVLDDSCDRLYPAESVVIARRPDRFPTRLPIGAKVVVRHFRGARRDGDTMEIVVGLLDQSVTGDLILALRSSNREIGASILVQPVLAQAVMSDRVALFRARDEAIDYAPRDDDPAEIIGQVVMAITPE